MMDNSTTKKIEKESDKETSVKFLVEKFYFFKIINKLEWIYISFQQQKFWNFNTLFK